MLRVIFAIYIMVGGFMVFSGCADADIQKIRAMFNIKQAYCSIKTNGVTGFDNRDSAWRGRGGGISSTNSLLLLENGENEVSLEFGALAWFYDKPLTQQERRHFDPQAACDLELVRFEGESKVHLASINVSISREGLPEAQTDPAASVIHTVKISDQVTQGHIDDNYFFETFYPKNMEVHQFSRKILIHGIPEWKWVNATPFTGDEKQINLLRSAYIKMARLINDKNRDGLKSFYKTAIEAWAKTTDSNEVDIFLSIFPKEKIEGGTAKIRPINWDDYDIRVMNKGRMVQFYNKSEASFSPLTYEFVNKKGHVAINCFAPVFSLVNGEFIPVI